MIGAPAAGPDEVEPNNNDLTAQALPPRVALRAKLSAAWADQDFFRVTIPDDAILVLVVDCECMDDLQVRLSKPYRVLSEAESPMYGNVSYTQVFAGDQYIQLLLARTTANYTVEVFLVDSLAQLFALPGDQEPNESATEAVPLDAGTPYSGAVGWEGDNRDFFAFEGYAGLLVEITADIDQGGPLELYFPNQEDFVGRFWRDHISPDEFPVRLLFQQDGTLVFATEGSRETRYTVHMTTTSFPLYRDGHTTLQALVGTPPVGIIFEPQVARLPAWANVHDGRGLLFDTPLCIRHALYASMRNVDVPEGQLFTDAGGKTLVAVGDPQLTLLAKQPNCVPAFAYTPVAPGESVGALSLGEVAPPEVRALLNEIAKERVFNVSGLVALWAVTEGVIADDVDRWMVTAAEAVIANQLLQAAGLDQRVPVPEEPPPNDPGGAGSVGGGSSAGFAMGAALIMAGVAILVAVPFIIRGNRASAARKQGSQGPSGYGPAPGYGRGPRYGMPPPYGGPDAATGPPPKGAPPPYGGPAAAAAATAAPAVATARVVQAPQAPVPPGTPTCTNCGTPWRPGYRACPTCLLTY